VRTPTAHRRVTLVCTAAGTAALLAGCSSSSSGGDASPTPSPTGSSFSALAQQALVTPAQVQALAGSGFEPYQSSTVASNAEPISCLELLHMADGTRTGPPSTASSATESFANGSTGTSLTNTAHVFASASDVSGVMAKLRAEVPGCTSFSVVVASAVLKAGITPAAVVGAPAGTLGLRVTITSPTQKADVTSAIAPAGRSIVVGVAGTPDGKDEPRFAGAVASDSAALAAAHIG
jgi:hypothetical protein